MGSCSFYASQEDLPYYYNGTSTVLLEDQLYHRKTNCCIGRSTVLLEVDCIIGRPIVVLEDRLYYWKSTVLLEDLLWCWKMNGRSKVLLENPLYWRQSTGLDGNYRSRKITARRWLHKYVGAECGTSSFTWYLYQMYNTDVRPERFPGICRRTHRGNGLKFCMLMYRDHLQNWLDYGNSLSIFLPLAPLWLGETGQICGFRAFPGERIERMGWNFACWCILTTFRTN